MPIPIHKNRRLILSLTLLGAFGGSTVLPYQLSIMSGGLSQTMDQTGLPFGVIIALMVFQVTVMTLIASWVGLSLAAKVGLDLPIWRSWLNEGRFIGFSKKWLVISFLGSFVGTLLVLVLEIYLFQPFLPAIPAAPSVSLWKGALTLFYGGIVEEVLVRLCLMTLLVWVFSRFLRNRTHIPTYLYGLAIIVAALLFGLGHLPATQTLFGELTPALIVRALISNGLLGIFFGYLYWKKGLEYAILSHMVGDFFLHVVWPSIFS
ncbi:CPBP family intramembrane metalloprotease [Paenibacillus alginolyticus]|uniref:CPBP family intramembrane glutamic endopeptidase n=1 Tax=Paenibacillus alginolyticus TaxID=59839 RepID=UPI0003FABC98|nr:CPBP family intramembrane glutamic endopeptidase [Paenibacillus alginolyticus]MCY9669811.1 CPBP family intramembrane metalloprotease [Paenibacillus alginolyticus]